MCMSNLRLGNIVKIYNDLLGVESPKQLDVLHEWFTNLIVKEVANPNNEKIVAEYNDLEKKIYAYRYNGNFYVGGSSTRVSQICGRLIGTAKGNKEKERRSANDIQIHVCKLLIDGENVLPSFIENIDRAISKLDTSKKEELKKKCFKICELEKDAINDDDLFPIQEQTLDTLLYTIAFCLNMDNEKGLVFAYSWLLLGSLLRNEIVRILYHFDRWLNPIHREPSENGTLEDKLNYLMHPDHYFSIYTGDDVDSEFPDIHWYCDSCGDYLNLQKGFHEDCKVWKCTKCGFDNFIDLNHIYETKEDYFLGKEPVDKKDFQLAILERKEEMDK